METADIPEACPGHLYVGIFARTMANISDKIRQLRKEKGITQQELADEIGTNRPVIGAYEEGRAEPSIQTLHALGKFFGISMDELTGNRSKTVKKQENNLRILPIAVSEKSNREKIVLVPVKAAAGYLRGFEDPGYVGSLPVFDLPVPELSKESTYRMFQIKGDSMLPVPSGAYIISSYVEDWNQVKADSCYVFITNSDGIVYKRVKKDFRNKDVITLLSDNDEYDPFDVERSEIHEIWKALGYVSFEIP